MVGREGSLVGVGNTIGCVDFHSPDLDCTGVEIKADELCAE
jgi:hypothetical protein